MDLWGPWSSLTPWPWRNIWVSHCSPQSVDDFKLGGVRTATGISTRSIFFLNSTTTVCQCKKRCFIKSSLTRKYKRLQTRCSIIRECAGTREDSARNNSPKSQDITACTKTLFYERQHFSLGLKGMGYMDVPPSSWLRVGFSTTRFARYNAFIPSSSCRLPCAGPGKPWSRMGPGPNKHLRYSSSFWGRNCGITVKP